MKHTLKLAAVAAALIGTQAFAQNIAIVNGKAVPSARAEALKDQVARSGRPVDEATLTQIKEELITREIFAQEAEKRGLKASKAYKAQAELALQTILIRELFADFQAKNKVSDAEAQKEYDAFKAENGGKEFRARHILVESEAEAKALIAAIQKGASFEDTAKAKSKDPGSGANGGDLDWANPKGYVPEFSNAMVKLAKGEMTATPVQSQFGWHIIRVDDVRESQFAPFDQVKDQIVQKLQQDKLQAFQDDLRKKAKIQ